MVDKVVSAKCLSPGTLRWIYGPNVNSFLLCHLVEVA
jgi:hypothetical protein